MRLSIPFVFFIILLASCGKKKENIHPTVERITESVYASGTVKSRNQYQVYSTTNGILTEKYVTEGDVVKKGDPLFKILNATSRLNTENARLAASYNDLKSSEDKLNQIKINIELARTKMQNDSMLWVRQRILWSKEVGSQIELEQRELAYKASLTAFEAATLNYSDVKKQLNLLSQQSKNNLAISQSIENDFTIKSEMAGRVYSILKEKGELVVAQSPIAVIGDSTDFYLELQVDEYDISKISIGQNIFLNLDSYKGQTFEARLSKIDPIMNDRSRTFKVEAVFVTKPAKLYPNLTVESNIVINTKENALTIPRNYLVDDIFVIKDNDKKVKVNVGLKDYEKAEILSGLTKDDVIYKPAK